MVIVFTVNCLRQYSEFYGGCGVTAAFKPVELEVRVRFPATALLRYRTITNSLLSRGTLSTKYNFIVSNIAENSIGIRCDYKKSKTSFGARLDCRGGFVAGEAIVSKSYIQNKGRDKQ